MSEKIEFARFLGLPVRRRREVCRLVMPISQRSLAAVEAMCPGDEDLCSVAGMTRVFMRMIERGEACISIEKGGIVYLRAPGRTLH